MTETSFVIRSCSGSSELMSRTARRTSRGSNRSSSASRMPARDSDHLIINQQRKHAVSGVKLRRFLSPLLHELGVEGRSFSVVLITDEKMRQYNRTYRGFDKPTDVLSFR